MNMKKKKGWVKILASAIALAAGIVYVIYRYEKLLIALLTDGSGEDFNDID